MKKPKKVSVACVAAVVAASSACAFARPAPLATPVPSRLFVTSEVLQSMFEIQREYEVETVKCLTGFIADGTVHVMSMQPTWINASNSEYASFRACDYPDLVGWFHNHQGYLVDGARQDVCAFSSLDINTHFGLGLPVAVVSCNATTIVWMYAGSLRAFSWSGEVPPPEDDPTPKMPEA